MLLIARLQRSEQIPPVTSTFSSHPPSFYNRYFQYLWRLPMALGGLCSPLPFPGQVAGRSQRAAGCPFCSRCKSQAKSSGLSLHLYKFKGKKKCSSVVAHLPWPCYGSSRGASAAFRSQPKLSLLHLLNSLQKPGLFPGLWSEVGLCPIPPYLSSHPNHWQIMKGRCPTCPWQSSSKLLLIQGLAKTTLFV